MISSLTISQANTPPSVMITSPEEGTIYSFPESYTITAEVNDLEGGPITVEFFVDDMSLGAVGEPPYSIEVTQPSAGNVNLSAIATDSSGAVGASGLVSIFQDQPSIVSLDAPVDGAVITSSSVQLVATAQDPDGFPIRVQFFSGDDLITEDAEAPFEFFWEDFTPGLKQLRADVIDVLGTTVSSSVSTIRVNQEPSGAITSPAEADTFSIGSSIILSLNASDIDGTISSVRWFLNDGIQDSLISEVVDAPFGAVLDNLVEGSYSLFATIVDNDGAEVVTETVTFLVEEGVIVGGDIVVLLPEDGCSFNVGEPFYLSSQAPAGTVQVDYYVNDGNQDIYLTNADATVQDEDTGESIANQRFETLFIDFNGDLTTGTYSLRAEAQDAAGAISVSPTIDISFFEGTENYEILLESEDLVSESTQTINLPANPSVLSFSVSFPFYDLLTQFVADEDGLLIPPMDTIEFVLLDENGQPVIPGFAEGRSAFLSLSEEVDASIYSSFENSRNYPQIPYNPFHYDGYYIGAAWSDGVALSPYFDDPVSGYFQNRVHIDVSHLEPGSSVTLVSRYINADDSDPAQFRADFFGEVEISEIEFLNCAPIPTTGGFSELGVEPAGPVNFSAFTEVDEDLFFPYPLRTSLNEITNQLFVTYNLQNFDDPQFVGAFVVVVESITNPNVTLENADGFTEDGQPYLNLSNSIVLNENAEWEFSRAWTLIFDNPDGIGFEYDLNIFTAGNLAPVIIEQPGGQNLAFGSQFTDAIIAEDPEGEPLFYELLSGPDGLSIHPQTGEVEWFVPTGGDNFVSVNYRVSDPEGAAVQGEFSLRIEVNLPPQIISPFPSGTAFVGFEYEYPLNVIDEDLISSQAAVLTIESGPAWLSVGDGYVLQGLPGVGDEGISEVTLKVTDRFGATDTYSYRLEVIDLGADLNQPPVFVSTPPTTFVRTTPSDNILTYQARAIDPDGDQIIYSLSRFSLFGSDDIDPFTGLLTLPLDRSQETFSIYATDGSGEFTVQTFTVQRVDNFGGNTPPVVTSTAPAQAFVGLPYRYDIKVIDLENQTLTFSGVLAPFSFDQSTRVFSFIPNANDIGLQTTSITITDTDGGIVVHPIEFEVVEQGANDPPVIESSPETVVREGESWVYQIVANDTDGHGLRYRLVEGPESMVVDELTGQAFWVAREPRPEGYKVEILVEDGQGGADRQPFTLQVLGTNRAPVFVTPELPDFTEDQFTSVALPVNGRHQAIWSGYPEFGDTSFRSVPFSIPEGNNIWSSGLVNTPNPVEAVVPVGLFGVSEVYTLINTIWGSTSTLAYIEFFGNEEAYYRYDLRGNFNIRDYQRSFFTVETVSSNAFNVFYDGRPLFDKVIDMQKISLPEEFLGETLTSIRFVDEGATEVQRIFVLGATARHQVINPELLVEADRVTPYQTKFEALDFDGDQLTYRIEPADRGASIDPATGLFTWQPSSADLGFANFTIIVNDPDGEEDRLDLRLRVVETAPNLDPVITSNPALRVRQGEEYGYQILARDGNGDPLTYSLVNGPSGMVVDLNGFLSWDSTGQAFGSYPVEVEASDSRGGQVNQLFEVNVVGAASNQLPVVVSTPGPLAVAGQLYRFDLVAEDPDGDPVTFDLVGAPTGAFFDEGTGQLLWVPDFSQLGTHTISIDVFDPFGGGTFTFDVLVQDQNQPPVFTSTPPATGSVGNPYIYDFSFEDPEGDAVTVALRNFPRGIFLDEFNNRILWTPIASQTGITNVTLRITDAAGNNTDQIIPIEIFALPENGLPVVVSDPVLKVDPDSDYQYQIEVNDPDGPFTFAVLDGPAGLAVDPVTGLVSWNSSGTPDGIYSVEIAITDSQSSTRLLSYEITVGLNAAPVIQSSPILETFVNSLYRYSLVVTDAENDPITYSLLTAPEGMTITEAGVVQWSPSVAGTYPVEVLVVDDCGKSATQAFDLIVSDDITAPVVTLIRTINIINQGEQVGFRVSANDDSGLIVDSRLTYLKDGSTEEVSVPLGSAASTFITLTEPGIYQFTGSAVDPSGNVGTDVKQVRVLAPGDNDFPFVTLDTEFIQDQLTTDFEVPLALQAALTIDVPGVVRSPVDIKGTVNDDNLVFYRLEIAPLALANLDNPQINDPDYVLLSEGNTNVDDEIVGIVDPSRFANGPYYVRILAEDVNGNVNFQGVVLNIDSDLKLGRLTYAITDLNIDLVGLPIQVTRIYDSLEADQTGDFGHGWKMAFREARLEESAEKARNEDVLGLFVATAFKVGDRVTVTNPEGRKVGFTFLPDLQDTGAGVFAGPGAGLFGTTFKPRFIPDPGVYDRLEVDNVTLSVQPDGTVTTYLITLPYNPETYRLITRDGTVYTYSDDGADDLQSIRDRNGNVLSFSNGRISHSSGAEIIFDRDSQGRITRITHPTPEGGTAEIDYEYDANGDLIKVTDQAEYETTLAYYQGQNVADPEFRGPQHYLKDIIDPDGNPVALTQYDAEGRLSQITDGEGVTTNIFYDVENRTETRINAPGTAIETQTVTTYDERGNVVQSIDERGTVSTTIYDEDDNPISITPRCGCTTTRDYDENGNVTRETDPEGGTTFYSYDNFSNLLSETDELGRTTRYSYDDFGQLTRIVNAEGNITTMTRDTSGRVTAIFDPLGRQTRFEYAPNNDPFRQQRPRKVIRPDGAELSFTYNAFGGVTSAADENGNTQVLETDEAGLLIARVDALNQRTEYRYNNRGEVIEMEDPLGAVTRMNYDLAGRIMEKIDANPDPEGENGELDVDMAYTYDELGRLKTATDALGRTTTRVYRPDGAVEKIIQPDLTEITFEYDNAARRTAVIDPNGNRTEFTYDGNGRIDSRTDPRGQVEFYVYDAADNLIQVTDRNGRIRQFTYDNLDRLIRETWISSAGEVVKVSDLEYDALGNLLSASDEVAGFGFLYDNRNRVENITSTYAGEGPFTLGYGYDAASRVQSVTDSAGVQVAMEYNDRNEATALNWSVTTTNAALTGFQPARVEMERNNIGDMTEISRYLDLAGLISAGKTTYSFDRQRMDSGFAPAAYNAQGDADRLANLRETSSFGPLQITPQTDDLLLPGNQPLQRIGSVTHTNQSGTQESRNDYMYDAAGQLITETLSVPSVNSVVKNYNYDPTGQLENVTSADTASLRENFSYDDSGNRLSSTADGSQLTTYTVIGNNRYQDVTVDGILWTFGYDEEGNLISKASVAAGEVWLYHYDHRNRMIKAEKRPDMVSPAIQTTTFTYDLFDRRIAKETVSVTQSLNHSITYRYNGDMVWSEKVTTNGLESDTNYYLTGDRIDQWLAKQTLDSGSATLNWYQADRLGSITGIADENGTTTVSTTYSAFGVIQDQAFIDSQEGTVFGFTGREFDPETGLYYYRARYYDPHLGRFISEDPIGLEASGEINLKRYSLNSPQEHTDPSGNSPLFQYGSNALRVYYEESLEFKIFTSYIEAAFIGHFSQIAFSFGKILTTRSACQNYAHGIYGLYSAYNSGFFIALGYIGPTTPLAAIKITAARYWAQSQLTLNYWRALRNCGSKPEI
ncbi:MAG: putative Ig domain-containing protein [Verrucomicrobiota bacterium]